MTLLSEIEPTYKHRIIDLVRSAGIDVSEWANFRGGKEKAASNPKYCYEWCFVEPKKVVVLNLWHASMAEEAGVVLQHMNYRKSAETYAARGEKPAWRRRSQATDEAIQTAVRDNLPIRVIVCAGKQRDINKVDSESSRVEKRLLDPMPWNVTAYNWATGACTVKRGMATDRFVDQFVVFAPDTISPSRRTVSGEVFVRSAEIRAQALLWANGLCQWCGQTGFVMPDGRVYLETHHVVPLSEDGPDSLDNVIALCANHHREAHYGAQRAEMRQKMSALCAEQGTA